MRHFPIFLDLDEKRIIIAGGGAAALAKLRLLMKTNTRIVVHADHPMREVSQLIAATDNVELRLGLVDADLEGASLVYAASENEAEDTRVKSLATAKGILCNIVDNLNDSDFITPAIVDRDPVTVAVGTEGAAPVLARAIKRDLEERLPARLGWLTKVGQAFRPLAESLPLGRARREFWSDFFFKTGPHAQTDAEAAGALQQLLQSHLARGSKAGRVDFVGAGPGDPELLTMKARHVLDRADVVIHDRLVASEILELARREAVIIEAGKTGFGASTPQDELNRLTVKHAQDGAHVVRLKSGDPTVFGRLDEEIEALAQSDIAWSIVPGITAASAAAASLGQSQTKRGRNSDIRLITGHDTKGFADHDWRALAKPGAVAAIYMGKRAARFVQGRLMMHGADPETSVSVVENASRADQRIHSTTLSRLVDVSATGPALTFLGLAPRKVEAELIQPIKKELAL